MKKRKGSVERAITTPPRSTSKFGTTRTNPRRPREDHLRNKKSLLRTLPPVNPPVFPAPLSLKVYCEERTGGWFRATATQALNRCNQTTQTCWECGRNKEITRSLYYPCHTGANNVHELRKEPQQEVPTRTSISGLGSAFCHHRAQVTREV